jgi:DAK2 domain fusion protein YloV
MSTFAACALASLIDISMRPQRAKTIRQLPIDGQALKRLIEAGLTWLRTNQQIVNSLNVFPVPDGDTGTNMVLTMQAAMDEISELHETNFGKMAHAVAHGALMGARGNSGVILSQLWRGFARAIDHQETLDAASLAHAFTIARDTAYKGVVRPVEGTILTVSKDIAAAAEKALAVTEDPFEILDKVVQEADLSVQRTPDLLAVLKEAGVVDAGGKGLFYILDGMLRFANGLPLDTALTTVQPLAAMSFDNSLETIEPGQDFEVVVDFQPSNSLDLESFYSQLQEMGTSIQVGEGEGIYRMHIHVPTEKLYEPINYTRSLGTITKVSIENLIAQMEALGATQGGGRLTLAPVEPGQIAVVAVSPGAGISRVFASLGVAAIVEGGQTMNPSTQEIINAFENLSTDQVIILPNNKNIILAAQAAAGLTVKKVAVIPSRTIPQGLAAMMRLAPDNDFNDVVQEMTEALDSVESGEITTATRSVEIDGVAVKEGQTIALHNGQLVLAADSVESACLGLLEKAHAEHFELITMFYGIDMPKSEVNHIADIVRHAYPDQEVEIQEGGQPHYQFIIAIE